MGAGCGKGSFPLKTHHSKFCVSSVAKSTLKTKDQNSTGMGRRVLNRGAHPQSAEHLLTPSTSMSEHLHLC